MKILNFGSLNIDKVYQVEHFVRPGETISSLRLDTFAGGKGLNQSTALAKAGAQVYHAGKIGRDGDFLVKLLEENGVDCSCIIKEDIETGHAIIQVDKTGQNNIILFGGANREITEKDIDTILSKFEAGDILLLQNEISGLEYIIQHAYELGMRIALNPSPIDSALLKLPLEKIEWFILNELEGKDITGETLAEDIIRVMLEKFPNSKVVLTLGEQGVWYADRVTRESHGIFAVNVVDTTAAGDTFTGYFLALTNEGKEVAEVLKTASKASAMAVSKPGAAESIPLREQVDNTVLKLKL